MNAGDFEDDIFKLVIKAFSDDEGEDKICTDSADDLDQDFFQDIEVERENDEGKFIAFETNKSYVDLAKKRIEDQESNGKQMRLV